MIGGRRLLTNAHCVEHHTQVPKGGGSSRELRTSTAQSLSVGWMLDVARQVKVKRRGDDTKFVATVLAIGTECDIALLAVQDERFWEGPEPLSLGALPRLQVGMGGWRGGLGEQNWIKSKMHR